MSLRSRTLPVTFMGQTFESEADLHRAYPAYSQYVHLIRKGADTPHKVEMALFARAPRAKHQSQSMTVKKQRTA